MSESPVEAWLDDADTQRDIKAARIRLAKINSSADPALFVLGVHILALLEFQQQPEPEPDPEVFPEEEDDEPWRKR